MKTDKFIKVTYRQIDSTPEEFQQRLDNAFDLLFDKVYRLTQIENAQALQI